MQIIVFLIIGALAALFWIASRKPDHFRTERKALISASPEQVLEQLQDLHKWQAWSPWAKLDPNAQNTFSGPEKGVGSALAWVGNRQVGEGRMEITSVSPSQVLMRLEFFKPMKATNTAEFILTPQGQQTELRWAMYGPQPFIGKLMSTVMDCDAMVGKQFEQGLANLQAVVTAQTS